MALPAAEDIARRTSAALAYASIDVKAGVCVDDRAISSATLARIVSAASPRGVHTLEELETIADACEVPRSFLLDGFTPDDPSLPERVEALERQLKVLLRRDPLRTDDAQGIIEDVTAIVGERTLKKGEALVPEPGAPRRPQAPRSKGVRREPRPAGGGR